MVIPAYFKTSKYEEILLKFGFSDIVDNPFVQRIKGISFLSTMDYIYNLKHKSSRYDHSLGAAFLALELSNKLSLTSFQREVLVIAYLLHDVGHAPFSHTSETFLVEKKRKYHEGLLNSYLRYNTRLFSESLGLSDLLSHRSDEVKEAVTKLLLNNKTLDPILDNIFFCSINCDKLDGTNRLLYSLGLDHFSPTSLLNGFTKKDDRLYIKSEDVDDLVSFWSRKKKAYEEYIYTSDVLASEAMLTRALEITYDDCQDLNHFLSKTDRDVFKELLRDEDASKIVENFLEKFFFKALSVSHPEIFRIYKIDFINSRFNKQNRIRLEHEIAEMIQIKPIFVISHFSYRKLFNQMTDDINQIPLPLFDDYNYTPIGLINKALFTRKLSGDIFEIFTRL